MGKKEKIVIYILFSIFIVLVIILGLWKISEKFAEKTNIYIFLTRQENNKIIVEPVKRKIIYYGRIENKIENAMNELIKGPTEEEKESGFFTCLNRNTKILYVNIEGDTLNLDFSKEVEEGGGTSLMEARIAQIVCTGTQFPEIKKVRFLIEGKPIKYFSGEGITIVEKPIGRDDLKEFDIEIIEEGNI
ncbi:MAG: GerMN domain-containing protein [Candidatus Omnitrophica bacterium]|nr:GerMN domain-containing protein [Candidatus Omnitrophota bacterium]MCM8802401.1 GerMN domain-containing protein [Candidatus Omnitrophota bacterium]